MGYVEKYCRAVQATDDTIMRLMRIVCGIAKTKKTHSEYVTLIAFPLQEWLHERESTLRYTYSICLASHGPQMVSACLWIPSVEQQC
jgi:hypothetical protein